MKLNYYGTRLAHHCYHCNVITIAIDNFVEIYANIHCIIFTIKIIYKYIQIVAWIIKMFIVLLRYIGFVNIAQP